MHPCRWAICLWVVILQLTVPGLPSTAKAQAPDDDNVNFVWAFEALVMEGNVTNQVPIK
jgi:hypothetical protein